MSLGRHASALLVLLAAGRAEAASVAHEASECDAVARSFYGRIDTMVIDQNSGYSDDVESGRLVRVWRRGPDGVVSERAGKPGLVLCDGDRVETWHDVVVQLYREEVPLGGASAVQTGRVRLEGGSTIEVGPTIRQFLGAATYFFWDDFLLEDMGTKRYVLLGDRGGLAGSGVAAGRSSFRLDVKDACACRARLTVATGSDPVSQREGRVQSHGVLFRAIGPGGRVTDRWIAGGDTVDIDTRSPRHRVFRAVGPEEAEKSRELADAAQAELVAPLRSVAVRPARSGLSAGESRIRLRLEVDSRTPPEAVYFDGTGEPDARWRGRRSRWRADLNRLAGPGAHAVRVEVMGSGSAVGAFSLIGTERGVALHLTITPTEAPSASPVDTASSAPTIMSVGDSRLAGFPTALGSCGDSSELAAEAEHGALRPDDITCLTGLASQVGNGSDAATASRLVTADRNARAALDLEAQRRGALATLDRGDARVTVPGGANLQRSSWSPDGNWLTFQSRGPGSSSELYLASMRGGKPQTPQRVAIPGGSGGFAPSGTACCVAWHPEGPLLFTASNDGGLDRLYILQPGGASPAEYIEADEISGALTSPSLAGSGDVAFVSTATGAGDVYLFHWKTNSLTLTETTSTSESSVSAEPAGARLVAARKRYGADDLFLWTEGPEWQPLVGGGGDQTQPVWVGDDVIYYTNERGAGLWDLALVGANAPYERRILAQGVRRGRSGAPPAVTPDGKWVMYTRESSGSERGDTVYFADLTGTQVVPLPTTLTAVEDPALALVAGRYLLAVSGFSAGSTGWRELHVIDVTGRVAATTLAVPP